MTSEWMLVLTVPLRLLAATLFVTCYVIGGRKWKWIRRFIGPILFALPLVLVSYLVNAPVWKLFPLVFLPVALCLGYSDDDGKGWIRRIIYGLALGAVGLTMGVLYDLLPMGLWQLVLAVIASFYMGEFNPVDAVIEEAVIAFMAVSLIPFMIS